MSTPNLLDAVGLVKENERIARDTYADAAQKIINPMGRKLFEELSLFEAYHYDRLAALERSLQESGTFISYESKAFPQPPIFEIKAAKDPGQKSVMGILSGAMDLEKEAEKAYADLASQVIDRQGHDMFNRLAEEEHIHYRILMEAYWSLTNLGEWTWSRP